ncbi:hypothetical protein L4C33_09570 [Vibrio makurazakiensis]|uniref:hypothetical protein n=1 Tax=Vibrio makurazakiensis TaxID=2910250 RepID=UPI003D09FDCB
MNLLSIEEAGGLTALIVFFVLLYTFIHVRYIRRYQLDKRFLAALWCLMKNSIHGENIKIMGYRPESNVENSPKK